MSEATVPRLLMLSGDSPGAGKTSVAAALAECVSPPVIEIREDDVWGRRELGDLPVDVMTARKDFRQIVFRNGDDRSDPITALFSRLVQESLARRATWLQDWAWPDLVRMTWRNGSNYEVMTLSAELRMLAEPLRPLILHLDVDPEVALGRAVAERGDTWFNRHFRRELGRPVQPADIQVEAAKCRAFGDQRLSELGRAGWKVLRIDGDRPLPVVAATAFERCFAASG